MNIFFKQPSETLDYDFYFSEWMPSGDSLASSVVVAPGLTLGAKTEPGGSIVKQFISGGVDQATYKVTCTITTAQGRVKEVDITIMVRDV